MKKEIEGVHNSIRNSTLPHTPLWEDTLRLIDCLADPNTGYREYENHDKIVEALLSGKARAPRWSDYGFKAGPECAMLEARFKFICNLEQEDYDLLQDADAKPSQVQALSLKAKTNGTALAFKYFWIIKGFPQPFRGMLSTTLPVKNSIKGLWGNIGGGGILPMSDFQHRLAHELDMNPNDLNTALWVLGQRSQ